MAVRLSAATIEATTDDGRKVILSPDGTWKFKEPAASLERKGENIKPLSTTEVIKSRRGFFELWYNPEKWSTQSGIKHDIAEFSLEACFWRCLRNGDRGAYSNV